MGDITVSAKTLEDAITEALIQLEITSDLLEYDVIEKGSDGFLGIGRKQAVIHARKKQAEVKPVTKEPAPHLEKVKEKTKEKMPEAAHVEEQYEGRHHETELAKVEEVTIHACETFLKDVLKAMDMEVEVTSVIGTDGALNVDLAGKNMGILIGKRGQTLDSLQYLTNRVANKMQEGYVRVKLDTEDYRKRRKETLENLAKNIAYKVKSTKKPVSLEPMNPYERRIIHSALQSDRYVTTHSEGEEPYRRVVVTLKK
ncbi:MAG: RNA-binding cell elongation regulator Jag/EloR [Lachnospiraceae bacterium]